MRFPPKFLQFKDKTGRVHNTQTHEYTHIHTRAHTQANKQDRLLEYSRVGLSQLVNGLCVVESYPKDRNTSGHGLTQNPINPRSYHVENCLRVNVQLSNCFLICCLSAINMHQRRIPTCFQPTTTIFLRWVNNGQLTAFPRRVLSASTGANTLHRQDCFPCSCSSKTAFFVTGTEPGLIT